MSSLQHVNVLWIKTLVCPEVLDEYLLKITFVECLPSKTGHSMRSFWRSNKHAALKKLANKAKSLKKLQEASRGVDTSNRYWSPNSNKSTTSSQKNWRWGNINAISSSDNERQTKSQSDIGGEIAIANAHERRVSSGQTTPRSQSTRSADDALYCRFLLSQSHRSSKMSHHSCLTSQENQGSLSNQPW